MIGQSIAHYRIVKQIGAGGMGRVFLAEDTKLDRQVALKVLLSPNPNASQVARFHREAKAAAALNHPNIVSIHELGTAGVQSYVVMEWLEGQTLRQRLEDGPPALPIALGYARDIIQGVVAAHEKGIYHRDLKPENIFITTDGRVKILDFGLAQMRAGDQFLAGSDNDVTGLVTTPGTMIGTSAYMSPEQVRGEAADHRSDIFAVGLMLYELLTGARPFREPTVVETMHAILKRPAPLDRIDPTVPRTVVEIVRRCLEKQPSDRFESARELSMAMQSLFDTASTSSTRAFFTADARVAPRPATVTSIAVLPFANMSGDPDMEYFSDGVTEEVINAIAQVRGLLVAARTSSFAFKGKSVSIQDVGAALNVSTVLEGSVRRSGQKLRIAVQLIQVSNGYQLWSERYDRQLDDVFAIQEDIASHIVQKLEVALTASAIGAIARPAATIEAYDLYLKGRYLVEQRGEGLVKGLEFFKQAIAVDPQYAPAYAGAAETLAVLAVYALAPPARVFPEAKAAAMRAIELDERLAEAHNAMAMVSLFQDWDWDSAGAAFNRALEINPNYVQARFWKGLLYLQLVRGQMTEALRETGHAVELDPMAMLPAYAHAIVLVNVGRYDEVIARCEARLAQNPAQFLLYRVLGVAYLCVGRLDEAIARLETGTDMSRRHAWFLGELGAAYAVAGRTEEAERIQAELAARAKISYVSPLSLASIPLMLGRMDEAVELFEEAFAVRDPVLVTATAWPLFDRARKDRRVQQLFERMGVRWIA
jgi:serine/threonine protein kinase/Flp pilus assembly protein TadD